MIGVEPDGLTVRHATGVSKVDFAQCPAALRRTYHYEPAKAQAYQSAQADRRRQADAQRQQTLQANEERRRARAQDRAAENSLAESSKQPAFVSRSSVSVAAKALADQMRAEEASRVMVTAPENRAGFWERTARSIGPGLQAALSKHTLDVPSSEEFKASLHKELEPSVDTLHDRFFVPIYATRSYYDDVDRAAAFARGAPLGH